MCKHRRRVAAAALVGLLLIALSATKGDGAQCSSVEGCSVCQGLFQYGDQVCTWWRFACTDGDWGAGTACI